MMGTDIVLAGLEGMVLFNHVSYAKWQMHLLLVYLGAICYAGVSPAPRASC